MENKQNKTLFLFVIGIVIVLAVIVVVLSGNFTGKATYGTGEAKYDSKWGWECYDDEDCERWERCNYFHQCVEKDAADVGVYFTCIPLSDHGTKSLDCSGFVINPFKMDYSSASAAKNVLLLGGFYTHDDSYVTTTKVYTNQGECDTGPQWVDSVLKIVEYEYDSMDNGLNLRHPEATVFCHLGDIEELDIGIHEAESSQSGGFHFRVAFEDEIPYVAICAFSTQTEELDPYSAPNCMIWYPEEETGACCYEKGQGIWDCKDGVSPFYCYVDLHGEWYYEQICDQINCPSILGTCCCFEDYIQNGWDMEDGMTSSDCSEFCQGYQHHEFYPGKYEYEVQCPPEEPEGPYGDCCCYDNDLEDFECIGYQYDWDCWGICTQVEGYDNYKLCEDCIVGINCPPVTTEQTGACCMFDDVYYCEEDLHQDTCLGEQGTWTKGVLCKDRTDNCKTGACIGEADSYDCYEMTQSECDEADDLIDPTWYSGKTCEDPMFGACCHPSDIQSQGYSAQVTFYECDDYRLQSECSGLDETWYSGRFCEDLSYEECPLGP